ncbi:pseudouridine synthase [Flavobacterium sp. I3-2]|uniref:pseudouridine synthase n=1 Tax=Flavobacterium sp. I3-2 TaxID=2748319 RepID=UPI0015AA1CCA|nr:pseudouridine synthase [Flavobacterium sp. I3-2]
MNPLEILYQDEYIIAINKPHGLLVHQSPIARDASEFAIQLLRDQIGKKVFPVHRLDRKTSGVLLFAFDKEVNRILTEQFTTKQIEKRYIAIVRGFAPEEMLIDYPLYKDNGVLQEAQTLIKCMQTAEIDLPSGKHQTSRYSLVEAFPYTGRMHQIRKHLAHILHPIIGDRPHGCNKQNKLWLEKYEMNTMMLHGASLKLNHPVTNEVLEIKAEPQSEFKRVMQLLNFK